jgi:hypothetical protein
MRGIVRVLVVVVSALVIPHTALAQAVIAGSVKDTSGAVLPGVTVEAASPVLIEKVRSAVSDGNGVFRIEDLRPGTYTVTFTLPGFATLKREGIVLTGSFTASVDAEMKVGGLEETVTVTGESPIVDVSSARRETTIDNEVLKAIPTVRSYNALVVVVPGVVTNLNDTVVGTATTQFPIHGGRNNEGRMTIDGLNVGNPPGGNQPPAYVADVGNAEEVTFSTSGGLGESETGGLTMNVVPKTGGNRISGSVFFSGTNDSLQSKKASFGLVPTPYDYIYDLNGAVGGPIKQDKIWYFVNARTQGSKRTNANQFFNLNAGDPTQWLYVRGEPGFSERTWEKRPRHVAGEREEQDQRLLGRAGDLPQVRGADVGHHRSGARVPRGRQCGRDQAVARDAGVLVIARDQPAPSRRRVRWGVLRVGQLRARSESHTRPDSRHRAVRGGMR